MSQQMKPISIMCLAAVLAACQTVNPPVATGEQAPAAVQSASAVQPPAPGQSAAPGQPSEAKVYLEAEDAQKVETITLTVRGYGAPPKNYYPEANRKLMAMRAAKLDAYRALAERIHGLRIWGGTSIGEMVLEEDRFRVMVDAFVVGARVVSIMPGGDGVYEAIVEAEVDQDFLAKALAHRKDVLTVPPESVAMTQFIRKDDSAAAKPAEKRRAASQSNFYFSD